MKAAAHCESHDHRKLSDFIIEILISLFACGSALKSCPPSMLPRLYSAAQSSEQRWSFASSARFLLVVFGYFPLILVLNRYLSLPDDLLVMAVQFLAVATLFFATYQAKRKIAEIIEGVCIYSPARLLIRPPVAAILQDFQPEVVTPPPNR